MTLAAAIKLAIDEHPMGLRDFSNESVYFFCGLCKRKISAEAYTCLEGCPSHYHEECLGAPPRIDRHPLHPDHPLTLVYNQEMFECNACWNKFRADSCSFRCDKCEFDLDIGCALITSLSERGGSQDTTLERMNIQHHPHQLTSFSTKHVLMPRHNCTLCLVDVEGDGYMCLHHWCEFLIHKGCSRDLFGVEGTNDPLQHPGHNHPLVPRDSRLDYHGGDCGLCHRKISTKSYICQKKCKFYVHRECAEAPPQIDHHPLHPDHPLTLSHRQPAFKCDACGEILCVNSSSFTCDECWFDLDIGCALSTLSYQGGSNGETTLAQNAFSLHPHPLTSFSSRRGFIRNNSCNLCNTSVNGDGYMCMHDECRFVIHKECLPDLYYADGTKAPPLYHCHTLKTFVGEDSCLRRCANCRYDTAGEFIGCSRCNFFIHRDCIGMPKILQCPPHPDHSLVLFVTYPNRDELRCESCSDPLGVVLSYHCNSCEIFVHIECALTYCKEGMSARIDWAWHKHPLFLCHKTKFGLNYCCNCGDESTGPTYVCEAYKCRFVLHERCIKIEPRMIHPHHPDHPLTLQRNADGPPPLCEACRKKIHGLIFSCELCSFHLHAQCAARVPTQKHYLHEHELLHFDEVPSLKCNRCGTSTDLPLFRCVPCNFNLHEKCMELPQVVKHETHVHPLTLQETYVEDDSGEYYCDLCEKRRDGRLGVYVCGQCTARWAFHIECILPELRKVFVSKGQSSVIKTLDKKIASIDEEVHKTEDKLNGMKRELDELMKQRAQIISREEKNYVAMTGEGEPGNPF